MSEVYISRLCAWAPGIESSAEWDEWALGKRDISSSAKGPDISFTDPMFRRRLSQISKMTIQVIHGLMPLTDDTKILFLSFRGELSRQYQINKMLIEESTVSPAAFSLSVFNAPVALASITLGLKGGYSAIYPGHASFASGIQAAQAALLCGASDELCLVYADEEAPSEYRCLFSESPAAVAFGFLLSRVKSTRHPCALLPPLNGEDKPLDYLKKILLCGEMHVSP
jgi:hypothetical protein